MLDQGEGFDPEEIADPLAPENLLKASGRGIFFMRSFMDDVDAAAPQRGRDGSADGQEARPDRVNVPAAPDPIYLATAIEAVMRAGDAQMAHFGQDMRVDKKGAIDLVTEIDIAIEREFRAMIADRFPDHEVLGEEFAAGADGDGTPRFCWVFDPIDGTTNYAHGLPIFCSSLALEVDGEPVVAAIYDPTRKELFTAERGQGAWLNGAPLRVSSAETLIDSLLVTGFHYDVQKDPGSVIELFAAFISRARAVRRLGSAALDLCYVAAGRFDGFWERQAAAVGRRRRRADRRRGGRPCHDHDRGVVWVPEGQRARDQRPDPRRDARGNSPRRVGKPDPFRCPH